MFPNVRLMVAAVLASMVALSCGFAMFATFRVNHDPLARLPAGATPYQLVAENLVPPAATFVADPSLVARAPFNPPVVTGTVPSPPVAKLDSGTDSPPPHDSAATTQSPDQGSSDPPAPVAATPVAAEPVDSATVVAAAPTEPSDQVAQTDAPADAPEAKPAETAPVKEAAQEEKPEDTTATVSPPEDTHPAAVAAPSIHAVERKAVKKRVHVRVARATVNTQPAPSDTIQQYPMANSQTYVPFGEQPAKRRLVLKIVSRRVAAKPESTKAATAKAAPASQSAVGGPFVPAPAQ